MRLHEMAREITDGFFPCHMRIGKVIRHPDGYKVKVVGGQYWGQHGLSNFWEWRKVMPNGKLSKKVYSGYGW